ncbi:MAG: maleylpyruvate isomerase N-terminal domain-containing protein [Actinomycetota bacterium]|nr:maleylpyruvate isomerase N-terminal domain-containing protein [Actinomycetota bacterium]
MNEAVRSAYLAAAFATADLLGRRELGERWDDPSVLPDFSIGALAGHLARGVLTVYWYLDMPEPDPPVVTAGAYYAAHPSGAPNAEINVRVRDRGAETAKGGWARLYLDVGKAAERLADRLAAEPAEHRVSALGHTLLIDEYLRTRIVEMAFHLDDLARSLGLPAPSLPEDVTRIAIQVLVETACVRHGDRAVLHALARRELDTVDALRVL